MIIAIGSLKLSASMHPKCYHKNDSQNTEMLPNLSRHNLSNNC